MFLFFDASPWPEIIKEERKEQGLTQTDLGKAIGKSMRTIQTYESGQVTPPKKVLEKIAEVFGESLVFLLDKYGYYDEYIPPHFNGDVDKYEAFKEAQEQDHDNELGLEAITRIYHNLNNEGKQEAYKRVSELSELKKYTEKK